MTDAETSIKKAREPYLKKIEPVPLPTGSSVTSKFYHPSLVEITS